MPRSWTKYASQKSAVITLNANSRYYIEALHKEGTGADNLAVGWKTPANSTTTVIPGAVLSPYGTTVNTAAMVAREGSLVKSFKDQEIHAAERFSIRVQPNPGVDYFTVTTKSRRPEQVQLKIMDATGKIVETKSNIAANSMIRIGSGYRPGIYLLEAQQGDEKVVIKLIKIKH